MQINTDKVSLLKLIRRLVAIIIIVSPFTFVALGWEIETIMVATVFSILAIYWEFGDTIKARWK